MQTHVKIMGWLHILFNGLLLLGGILLWVLFAGGGAVAAADPQTGAGVGALMAGFGTVILGCIAVVCLPGVIIGWGLVQQRSWGRVGGIILSLLHLLTFPVGTILGIYSLIVLFNQETVEAFEGRRAWTN